MADPEVVDFGTLGFLQKEHVRRRRRHPIHTALDIQHVY